MPDAFVDKLRIADIDPVFCLLWAIAAVQAVVQYPRYIVPMDNTPDQGFSGLRLAL